MTRMTRAPLLLALGLTVAACDEGTGPNDGARMTAGFSIETETTLALAPSLSRAADGEILLTGTNGTLRITDVAFIVGEFKLEGATAACGADDDDDFDDDSDDDGDSDSDDSDDVDGDDDCDELETGLYFVDLPLDGDLAPVLSATIPAGTYTEFKLEVEDADLDEAEDDDDGDRIAALIADIEAAGYTDWPEDASLVVVGDFTPTGGVARPFVSYFEAEIKVEMELDPALVVDGESGTLDITIDPVAWFTEVNGAVIDLSAFDYATTGAVLEFEAKMEHGFTKIELEGFDD